MTKQKPVIILSTFSDIKSASEISRKLVEKKLCACANITEVRSVYFWKGKVEDQPEFLAVFKTTKTAAKNLKKELEDLHPYELPEIVEIKVSDISKPYLNWLVYSTKRVPKNGNDAAKR